MLGSMQFPNAPHIGWFVVSAIGFAGAAIWWFGSSQGLNASLMLAVGVVGLARGIYASRKRPHA